MSQTLDLILASTYETEFRERCLQTGARSERDHAPRALACPPRALGGMFWLLGSLIWARDAKLHLPSTNARVQLAPKTRCPTKYSGCHRVKKTRVTK